MRAVLYVPYSNGDCINGFKYDKHIDQKTYAQAMIDSYNQHKDGVDMMVMNSDGIGMNMARNPFRKERNKYNQQTFYYQPVECKVFDIDNKDEKIDELLEFYKTGEQFIVIVALLDMSSDESGELESDVKSWANESMKINRTNRMTEDEKLKSLSKKSLKLKFKDSNHSAILKNCKMVEVYSRNKFAFLVEKIDFIKDIN